MAWLPAEDLRLLVGGVDRVLAAGDGRVCRVALELDTSERPHVPS